MSVGKSEFVRSLLLGLVASFLWGGLSYSVAFGQPSPTPNLQPESGAAATVPSRHIKFEVVSIHPSRPNAGPGSFAITADGYRQVNEPLIYTLLMAYLPVANFPMDRIRHAPSWVKSTPYDIQAKVAPEDVPLWRSLSQSRTRKDNLEAMLQEVLRERMHLRAHRVPTSVNGYALIFRKQSSNLIPSNNVNPVPAGASLMPAGGMMMHRMHGSAGPFLEFYKTSMDALAMDLTQEASATSSIIENHTGLAGTFDFTLPERTDVSDSDQDSDASNVMVLPWDVRAIGLDLVSTKVASWNLIIDHIERPSEN